MKKLLLLTFAFYLSTCAFAQQYGWVDISANMPELSSLSDIHAIGDEVWITGGNDKVYYSPNGGATFLIQNLPPQPGNSGISSSIFMKNNKDGYVVTYSGEMHKTNDGGTTWTTLHKPGGGFTSIHFPPNSDIGFACGWGGKIWTFDDNSITDISVSGLTADLLSIMFPEDSTEGKLCGDSSIRRWRNSTWNNMQIFDNRFVWNSIFFIDNNTGWVVGTQGKIFKTIDATVWNPQLSGITKGLNDVFFINPLEGWIAGSEVILHTVDGGENWTENTELDLTGKILTALWFNSPHEGYAVSNKGTLYKYTELTTEANNDATLSSIQINSEELSGFNTATLNYQVELPTGTSTIPTVAASPTDTNATVVITQADDLRGTATILVTAEDGLTQQTYTIEFSNVTNVFEITRENSFDLFPNPAQKKFKVQGLMLKDWDATLEIYNLNGRKLFDKQIPAGTENVEIDVSHLKNGVYFCKLLTDNGNATKKLIIKN